MLESDEPEVEDSENPRPRHRALPAHLIANLPSEYVNTEGRVTATLPSYGDRVDGPKPLPPPYMYVPRGSFSQCINCESDTSHSCPPSYDSSQTSLSSPRVSRHRRNQRMPSITLADASQGPERF